MKIKILFVFIFTLIFLGCNDNIIYREFINLGNSWSLNKKARFTIDKTFSILTMNTIFIFILEIIMNINTIIFF